MLEQKYPLQSLDRITSPCTVENPIDRNNSDNSAKALWDTGATHSCITPKLAKKLNLSNKELGTINFGGHNDVPQYYINLSIKDKIIFKDAIVFENSNENLMWEFDLIIGMDLIKQGDFAITREKGTYNTVFSFNQI